MTKTRKPDRKPPQDGGEQFLKPPSLKEGRGGKGVSGRRLSRDILNRRICDFDLRIEGGPLDRVIERFRRELNDLGITKLNPAYYLSDEWGVLEGTVAIAIPFYLADERLRQVAKIKSGVVEGRDDEDILRYLRHEMGHVVNYAYRLSERDDWTAIFGPMSRPYADEYRSVPFSPDFVRHLPGHYAQKHPDDDWSETFAVWMTPGSDWRTRYQDAPVALAKLSYCERVMAEIKDREPSVTAADLDEEVCQIHKTVQEFYDGEEIQGVALPRSLDGDLRGIFAPGKGEAGSAGAVRMAKASSLIRRNEDELASAVHWWTGVDHSLTYAMLDHLADRADEMNLAYPPAHRDQMLVQLTAFLTTLAMNFVYKGSFIAT